MKETREEIEKTLVELELTPVDIILFGSRAKNSYTEESDWDILVVMEEDLNLSEKKKVWYRIYKNLHKRFKNSSFDVFIKSQEEFNSEKYIVNTVSDEAFEEGVAL